jgi:hypothetical protein
VIDKLEAARRQIECAIRLVATVDDELAVHTLTMAAFGIVYDLAKGTRIEQAISGYLTKIGRARLTGTAAFLKHADRDPDGVIASFEPAENDWRIGLCVLIYRLLAGAFTPTMAAFHCWMITKHPEEFRLAEDSDLDFERAYRASVDILRQDREVDAILLQGLLKAFEEKLISPETGFARR